MGAPATGVKNALIWFTPSSVTIGLTVSSPAVPWRSTSPAAKNSDGWRSVPRVNAVAWSHGMSSRTFTSTTQSSARVAGPMRTGDSSAAAMFFRMKIGPATAAICSGVAFFVTPPGAPGSNGRTSVLTRVSAEGSCWMRGIVRFPR